MLVGKCSCELSGRKLDRKIKKSETPGKPRDPQFYGPLVEAPIFVLKQNCHLDRSGEICGLFKPRALPPIKV
jgi:hypothetical protein